MLSSVKKSPQSYKRSFRVGEITEVLRPHQLHERPYTSSSYVIPSTGIRVGDIDKNIEKLTNTGQR